MAIKKNHVYKGIPISDAYVKVTEYRGRKIDDKEIINFDVEISAIKGSEMLEEITKVASFEYKEDGGHIKKQCYDALILLDDYKNSSPC